MHIYMHMCVYIVVYYIILHCIVLYGMLVYGMLIDHMKLYELPCLLTLVRASCNTAASAETAGTCTNATVACIVLKLFSAPPVIQKLAGEPIICVYIYIYTHI